MNLLFPKPKRFKFLGIETFGYENEVIFPIVIERLHKNKQLYLKVRPIKNFTVIYFMNRN